MAGWRLPDVGLANRTAIVAKPNKYRGGTTHNLLIINRPRVWHHSGPDLGL